MEMTLVITAVLDRTSRRFGPRSGLFHRAPDRLADKGIRLKRCDGVAFNPVMAFATPDFQQLHRGGTDIDTQQQRIFPTKNSHFVLTSNNG